MVERPRSIESFWLIVRSGELLSLPEPFNMIEIMGKVEERTPYVVVAFQVSVHFETFKIDTQNFQINCCEKSSFSFFVFIRNVKE